MLKYLKISFLKSKLNYYYLDYYNGDNVVYYRLVQYDIDGEYDIYGPISLIKTTTSKILVKCVNLMGQEVGVDSKGVIIEVYDDGTMRKIIR